MIKVLLLFIIIISGCFFGPILSSHQYHLLIQTNTLNIKTNITLILIMLILIFTILLIVAWVISLILNIRTHTRIFFDRFKHKNKRKNI
ncbi:heme biosynthesis HemY N-terminal domain-containing protein [Candidatus Profftia sp. (ex Adelges kitamiensis)]|uniref:heme biosynthesis HemY N-terminal domain-containing protein n=1 Tax=Candidatus Profftia sp. (ex Adelges kitamiensis) TaxID=2864218 RepID=UPI001CE2ECE2